MKGRIFKFESMAAKDGDGLRAAVFFSGCPLRCAYCHNPDSWQGGEEIEAVALADRIARYKSYFGRTGGATLSGGEPLCQGAFALELVEALHARGVNVALDTAGAFWDATTPRLIAAVDHIILDLKFPTEEEYRRYTGGSLADVLRFLDAARGKRLWIRTVVIPGINDSAERLRAYAALVRGAGIERYELLPFHTMGFEKYGRLGLVNPFTDVPAMDAARTRKLEGELGRELGLLPRD